MQGHSKNLVAYTSTKFDLSSSWIGVPDFRGQTKPDVNGGESVDVVIFSKARKGPSRTKSQPAK